MVEQGRVVNSLLQGVFRVVAVLELEPKPKLVVLVLGVVPQPVVMVTEVLWQEHIH